VRKDEEDEEGGEEDLEGGHLGESGSYKIFKRCEAKPESQIDKATWDRNL
jgi:hypothetical protein